MQLYFSPFACSMASHIVVREAGLDVQLVPVTLTTKKTAAGDDYFAVNPKGQVPALRLADGSVLTEGAAVLQYLADQKPDAGLLPPAGTPARYETIAWLNYVGTELHKACFAVMFSPDAPEEAKAWARGNVDKKLAYVASQVDGRRVLAGDRFTIADAYLTWALTLCGLIDVALPPACQRYLDGMQARPAVQAAIAAEREAAAAAQRR